MMYEVKHYEFEEVELEQTLFQSVSEKACWDFIRNHLTCGVPSVREKAKLYVVMDSLGRIYSPSMDVRLLKEFNMMNAGKVA